MGLQAQQHCAAVDTEQQPAHTRALMRSLADWAEAHRALNEVIQLPLLSLEEEASLSSPSLPSGYNFLYAENAARQGHLQSRVGCLNACLQGESTSVHLLSVVCAVCRCWWTGCASACSRASLLAGIWCCCI